ncbi:MAG: HAMP domain-containing sensor histidine kinase [Cyclobacteriaceae bacterium]
MKLNRKKLIWIYGIWLLFSFRTLPDLTAQNNPEIGLPLITNYPTTVYNGNGQVWSIIQDNDGIMYFGTSSEIMEFDGINWRQIRTSDSYNAAAVRGMAMNDKGVIFYGNTGDFGYVKRNELGNQTCYSLKELIPKEYLEFEQIWSVQFDGEYIYFQAREYLFKVNADLSISEKRIEVYEPKGTFSQGFILQGNYFIHDTSEGILKMVDGKLELLPGGDFFTGNRLFTLLPYDPNPDTGKNQFLAGMFYNDLYLFDGDKFVLFESEINQYLTNNLLYKSVQLSNGNYALSVIGIGLVVLDRDGKIVNTISSEAGLQDPSIYSVFVDNTGIVWTGLDNGISKIELNSQISSFSKQSGIPSTVLAINRSGGILYITTPIGLYEFNAAEKQFKPIPKVSQTQIWQLRKDGDDLLVPGSKLSIIRNGKIVSTPIDQSFTGQDIMISKRDNNVLYAAGEDGVNIYFRENANWKRLGAIELGPLTIWSLAEDKEGGIWAGTQNNVTYRLLPSFNEIGIPDPAAYTVEEFNSENGIINAPGLIYAVNGEIYIPAFGDILKYDAENKQIITDNTFGEIPNDLDLSENFFLQEDASGRVWIPIRNKIRLATPQSDGGYKLEEDLFNAYPWQSVSCIFPEENGIVWIGSGEGLVRFDMNVKAEQTKEFSVLLRKITTREDTLSHIRQESAGPLSQLSSDNNSLRFQYAAQFYEQEHRTLYQTYLEGFDEDWSDWDRNSYKEYTNLSSGTYTFHARAKNIYNTLSNEATYTFTILPPWYATLWAYIIYAGLFAILIYILVKFQSRRMIARERERSREKELAHAKEIEKAYENLKSTQNQLIHSEKMASLGELTAGIAHEIQNPLNFVNNFSEVNTELAEELEEEIKNGNYDEAIEITHDIIENEKKIAHHGKRAEGIVKSMLQHSRGGDGQIEPTDINALADEYLRLAFHGMRAKDKSFNVNLDTEFDESLEKVNVVPQDIGRVILNLITNGFHTLTEKKNQSENGYQPTLYLSTQKLNDQIRIYIRDNGNGIPDNIKEKIFQPFFSTKGTGEGTGLGLSLSYEIITKGHGGKLEVSSKAGEGSEFIISIPIKP